MRVHKATAGVRPVPGGDKLAWRGLYQHGHPRLRYAHRRSLFLTGNFKEYDPTLENVRAHDIKMRDPWIRGRAADHRAFPGPDRE